jgi:ATP-dependent DNA helicase 2 subunit 2
LKGIKSDYEVLYYNKLPFAEDIRQYPFASLLQNPTRKSYIPSEAQLNAAELLINELDLMKAETDDEGYDVLRSSIQQELVQYFVNVFMIFVL